MLQAAQLKVEGCFSPGEALSRLQTGKFDAIVVDCTSVPDSTDVLEALRQGRSNRKAIAFAITDDPDESRRAFKAGANFAIEKPITADRVQRSLRAAQGLLVRERRRYIRIPVDAKLSVDLGDGRPLHWNVIDVSEGGLSAVVPDDSGVPRGSLRIKFNIPDAAFAIEGKAEVIWHRTGKVGLQFTLLRPQSRADLDKWLGRRFEEAEQRLAAKRILVPGAGI
jgi:CheY-like chemotaxis protein